MMDLSTTVSAVARFCSVSCASSALKRFIESVMDCSDETAGRDERAPPGCTAEVAEPLRNLEPVGMPPQLPTSWPVEDKAPPPPTPPVANGVAPC